MGKLLNERICSHRSKFFPFKSRTHLFFVCFFLSQKAKREAKRESQKLLPFVKMVEKYSGIPINIKVKNGYTSRGGFKRNLTAILLGNSV